MGINAHATVGVFYFIKGTKNWQAAFNRIRSKHIDFVLCDKFSKPVVVIELDDRSHKRAAAVKGDKFKDDAFAAAGIRFVRFAARRSYNCNEIKQRLLSGNGAGRG